MIKKGIALHGRQGIPLSLMSVVSNRPKKMQTQHLHKKRKEKRKPIAARQLLCLNLLNNLVSKECLSFADRVRTKFRR